MLGYMVEEMDLMGQDAWQKAFLVVAEEVKP